jgi:hypothetical protein
MSLSQANAIDWKFWLGWTVVIALPIGWFISLQLLYLFGVTVAFAIYRVILGPARWLILRQKFSALSGWIPATSVGMAVDGQIIYHVELFVFGD